MDKKIIAIITVLNVSIQHIVSCLISFNYVIYDNLHCYYYYT